MEKHDGLSGTGVTVMACEGREQLSQGLQGLLGSLRRKPRGERQSRVRNLPGYRPLKCCIELGWESPSLDVFHMEPITS